MADEAAVATADMAVAGHGLEKGWQSTDLLQFNDAMVRFRTMHVVEAHWHKHTDSDELFIVMSGCLEIDVREDESSPVRTHMLNPGQLLAIRRGHEHRARSRGLTTLLALDAIRK